MTHDELIEAAKDALANTTDFDGDRLASRFADSELADMARAAIRVIAPAMEQEAVAKIVAYLRKGEKEFSDCDCAAELIEQGIHLEGDDQ